MHNILTIKNELLCEYGSTYSITKPDILNKVINLLIYQIVIAVHQTSFKISRRCSLNALAVDWA